MTANVPHARGLRAEGSGVCLLAAQGVHVSPVGDDSTGLTTAKYADHSMATHPGADFYARGAQTPGDNLRGALFLARCFGVPVQIMPQFYQTWLDLFELRSNIIKH